jgi:hypothetical protein
MVLLAFLLVGWYVFVAGLLFRTWLRQAEQDKLMTPNQQIASWVLLLLATTFWGITLPLTYLELLKKRSPAQPPSVTEQSLRNLL